MAEDKNRDSLSRITVKLTMSNQKYQTGYIALTSVLVIASIIVTISLSISLLAISDNQMSLATNKSALILAVTEGCVENALLELNKDNSLPSVINLPEASCNVTVNSQAGNNWDFTVSSSLNSYSKKIQVQVIRGSQITVNSWQQIE